eukprot:TRINITY_DN22491_c0_g1_i1.p1 TRINITY_DN22491_c0_g1~~TRINITY_DN22491_c0_g1_i1.p1  ORF type:complete len:131 (-),score=29.11 TRINITY_DN22491_c0_g1_i1:23-415(-)
MLVRMLAFSSPVKGIFIVSKISRAFSLALSNPSVMILGVETLGDVEVCLLQELSNKEDSGGGSISGDVVLSCGSSGDQTGSWVLDLHLMEKDISVLGDLDVTGSSYKHLHRSLGPNYVFRTSWYFLLPST